MTKLEASLIDSFILMNQFLQQQQIRYCLIGGMAAGFWGEPRYTKDMDFTLVGQQGSLEKITETLKKEKFRVVNKGPAQIQVMQHGDLHFIADLILVETEYQDWVVQRAISVTMFDIQVPICSPEDLIILKMIAHRRQDLLDVENVLKNCSARLDRKYLQKWLEFWEVEELFEKEFGKD